MKITADTNVLVRAVVCDDPAQVKIAAKVLLDVTLIAIALPSLCEFVWVLRKVYGFMPMDAASAIRPLLAAANGSAVEAGGDFDDGVIAYEGHWLGGETFVSFVKKAVALLKTQG